METLCLEGCSFDTFIKHRKEDKPKIRLKSVDSYKAAETCIIKDVQQEMNAEGTV